MNFIEELIKDTQDREIGFAIVVHDPDPDAGDYVVGPFTDREVADGYASGTLMQIGQDGAAMVVDMMLPFEPDEFFRKFKNDDPQPS